MLTRIPLLLALASGIPLIYELLKKLLRRQFGSDLLALISIITSVILGEYLAGSIGVLMLEEGEALRPASREWKVFSSNRATQRLAALFYLGSVAEGVVRHVH